MVDAPTLAQRFSDHFKRGRQAPHQLCEYWVGVDGETGELGAEWADKPHRLVFDLLHHAVFQENEIENLRRQIAELQGERNRAIDERDEARQEPWPKWADEIRKCLEGYGVDPGDEWDLPEQFEMWIAGVVENETARLGTVEAENARLSEALMSAAMAFRTYAASAEGPFATRYELAKDLCIQADLIDTVLSGSGVQPSLPLKDERHLTLDEQKTFDDALRNSGTVRQVLPLKDEVERVLEEGRKNTVAVMKALMATGSRDNLLLADAVHRADDAARALLSRLQAGEQEGWRHGPYGYLIKPIGLNEEHWHLAIEPSAYPDEEVSIPLYADQDQLPAAPSEHGGKRG